MGSLIMVLFPMPSGAYNFGLRNDNSSITVDLKGLQKTAQKRLLDPRCLSRCSAGYWGLDSEFCTPCWSFEQEGRKILAAECTGEYYKGFGSSEPLAQEGFAILPPHECQGRDGACKPAFESPPVPRGCDLEFERGMGFRGTDRIVTPLKSACDLANHPGKYCQPHRLNGSVPFGGAVVWSARHRARI